MPVVKVNFARDPAVDPKVGDVLRGERPCSRKYTLVTRTVWHVTEGRVYWCTTTSRPASATREQWTGWAREAKVLYLKGDS